MRICRNMRSLLAKAALFVTCLAASSATAGRQLTVDDYLAYQRIGETEVAADGEFLAVTYSRPSVRGDNYRTVPPQLSRVPLRDDLVVISVRDGSRRITVSGGADGSSVSDIQWSRSGKSLAYLWTSRTGRSEIRVWDRVSGHTQTLAVGIRAGGVYIASGALEAGPFAWIDESHLAYVEASGDEARSAADVRGGSSARIWKTEAIEACRPSDRLIVVEAAEGKRAVLASGPVLAASFSADGNRAAIISFQSFLRPPPRQALPAYANMLVADWTPFIEWRASFASRGSQGWTTSGGRFEGKGPIRSVTIPRWIKGRWALFDVSDVFGFAPASRITYLSSEGRLLHSAPYAPRPAMLAEFAKLLPAQASALPPDAVDLKQEAGTVVTSRLAAGGKVRLDTVARGGAVDIFAVTRKERRKLFSLNEHLIDVEAATPLPLSYEVDGHARRGWLFLPKTNAIPPVLVTAYPSSQPRTAAVMAPGRSPVLQEALRRGMAVFVIDLRLSEPGTAIEPADWIQRESAAAMRALRKDPRVHGDQAVFFGHSFGGYTALNLLVRSNDYRAIITYAAVGDILSHHFQQWKYLDARCGPAQAPGIQMLHEDPGVEEALADNNNVMRMGGPPFDLQKKYIYNSPLLQLRSARAPLLIIQGSEDSFNEGERLFNMVYRLGGEAELIYYEGEGHVVSSPDNVRDLVSRTVSWALAHVRTDASKAVP